MLETRVQSPGADVRSEIQVSWANGQFYATSLTHDRSASGPTREAALRRLESMLQTALAVERRHPDARERNRALAVPRWLRVASAASRYVRWRRIPSRVTMHVRVPD
jgi:hypothetical protein